MNQTLTSDISLKAQALCQQASTYLCYLVDIVYGSFLAHFPRFQNLNRFEKFIILNLIIFIAFFFKLVLQSIDLSKLKKSFWKKIFKLPFISSNIQKELVVIRKAVRDQIRDDMKSQLKDIPYKNPDIKLGDRCDQQSLKGQLSGARYPVKSHSDFVMGLAKKFSLANPLHPDSFPLVKQMQVQVISMCAKMLNFTDSNGQAVGSMNAGGTQSILLSILAYREYMYKEKGIKNPNIVFCKTAHVAVNKAANYFDIQMRTVGMNKKCQMDLGKMKSQIDSNTVCVYASYPNYPYGTVDDVEAMAAYCLKKGVPMHVDLCLGGFIVPFLKSEFGKQGYFKLPKGVTSVSVDAHKYGLAAKGASINLYSDEKYRAGQFYCTTHWPGGLYGTQGFAGSRSGTPIASSWISMMKMGEQGYRKNAEQVQNGTYFFILSATLKLAKQLRLLGFITFGEPSICVVGFTHDKYPLNMIQDFMKEREWHVSLNQKPISFHYSITPLNSTRIDDMIKDFQQCLKYLSSIKITKQKDSGLLQLYGACAKIPDGNTKDLILCNIMDCYHDI